MNYNVYQQRFDSVIACNVYSPTGGLLKGLLKELVKTGPFWRRTRPTCSEAIVTTASKHTHTINYQINKYWNQCRRKMNQNWDWALFIVSVSRLPSKQISSNKFQRNSCIKLDVENINAGECRITQKDFDAVGRWNVGLYTSARIDLSAIDLEHQQVYIQNVKPRDNSCGLPNQQRKKSHFLCYIFSFRTSHVTWLTHFVTLFMK